MESNNPVVLMFGLMRPYKGIDVLLQAWRGVDGQAPIEDAELWIAGLPKMDISALQAAAPANVRFDPHFVTDDELPAYFERADLVVLPYLQADQSGVLFTALAFGKPLLLSDVGGFPEMEDTGAARIVPAGDAHALGQALRELLHDRAALTEMCVKARAAAHGRYSWETSARAHVELYCTGSSDGRMPLGDASSALEIVFWVSAGLIVWTQVGYPLAIFLLARVLARAPQASDGREARTNHPPYPAVSLIVAAHDEEGVISAKVENALALDYPRERLEVIVACDGCSGRHGRASARRRRGSRAGPPARWQDRRAGRRRGARERGDRCVLRRQRAVGAGRAAKPGRRFRGRAGGVCVREGHVRAGFRGRLGHEPGGRVLALRDGAARARVAACAR